MSVLPAIDVVEVRGRQPGRVQAPEALAPRPKLRHTTAMVLIGCLLLAIVSVFALPSTPSYDPWGWLVWGREVAFASSAFATTGGPSWKPLPVMLTSMFALLGGAAPKLWLITARAGGLLALVAAYRLSARLISGAAPADARETRVAGAAAGALAAIALLLTQETTGSPPITQDWIHYLFRGASEPMLVACVLWGVDCHLRGRRALAFLLGVAACLIRPEGFPFAALYGLWLWREERRRRPLVLGGLVAIPLLWFVPSWISVGDPFTASTQAQHYNGHLGSHPFLEVLHRAAALTTVPVLIAAAACAVLAWRDRDRLTLTLAAGALAWVLLVALMALGGYPGLGRFMYPAAGVACVLGGAGVVAVARLAGSGVGAVVLGAALVAVSVPFAYDRASASVREKDQADLAARIDSQLRAAVRVAGGRRSILPCRTSVVAVNHTMQTSLAWTLDVPLMSVRTTLRRPGVDLVGPHLATIDGAPAPIRIAAHSATEIARAGVWRVLRITRSGSVANRCAGF